MRRLRNVHHFVVRTTTHEDSAGGGTYSYLQQNNVTTSYGHQVIKLSNIPNIAELASNYDHYIIDKVVTRWIPRYSRNSIEQGKTGTSQPLVKLYTALDKDGGNPITEAAILEYGTCRRSNGYNTIRRTVYPRALGQVYRTAISTAYTISKKCWIDMAYNDVPHYGHCYVIPGSGGATINDAQIWDLYSTYYFRCKSTR